MSDPVAPFFPQENAAANRTEDAADSSVSQASAAASGDSSSDSDSEAEVAAEAGEGRQVRRRQLGSLSPLDAILAVLRRSWDAPARSCGPSWMCRLVHLARILTEPLTRPSAAPGLRRAPDPPDHGPGHGT